MRMLRTYCPSVLSIIPIAAKTKVSTVRNSINIINKNHLDLIWEFVV